MIYYCKHCESFFHEDDLESTSVCLEDEYGVSSMFNGRTYEEIGCCPHCGDTEISEASDTEILEEFDALHNTIYKLKEKVRKLEEKCKSLGID